MQQATMEMHLHHTASELGEPQQQQELALTNGRLNCWDGGTVIVTNAM